MVFKRIKRDLFEITNLLILLPFEKLDNESKVKVENFIQN